MANFNKVILMGNLTRDPESRYLPSGNPVCELGLAVNRTWTDQSGEKREQTCFVDLVAYGRQAETLGRYMTKGRPLFIEGRLDYSSWETPEGQKRSKLRVVVDNFQFMGSRDENAGGGGGGDSGGAARMDGGRPVQPSSMPSGDAEAPAGGAAMAVDEDDIPF